MMDELRKIREEITATSTIKFNAQDEEIAVKLTSASNLLKATLENSLATLERKLESKISNNALEITEQSEEIQKIQLQFIMQERREWLKQKIYRNALQTSTSALRLANKIGEDYGTGNILDLVSEDISSIVSKNEKPIDNFLIAQLVDALDSVKGSHAHAAATLKMKAITLSTV